jgi:gluconate 2-dehydrogenase gamma chain
MMDRRIALQLIGMGVAAARVGIAQEHLHTIKTRPQNYTLQFFTPAEDRLIDQIAEMILPADDHSPGAHAAGVSKYIDLVVDNSPADVQANWKSGLAAMGNFLNLSPAEQKSTLDKLCAAESHPATPAEQFFAAMKKATLFGYYTSQIGLIQELDYKGNEVLSSFPGCPQ